MYHGCVYITLRLSIKPVAMADWVSFMLLNVLIGS